MDKAQLEQAFRAWWQESYGLPPGTHAVMTHTSWAEHLAAAARLRDVPALPDGLTATWSDQASQGGEATLAEADQRIAELAVAWAWEQFHAD